MCVCVDSPISPNQTLAAVFHLSLSALELRGEEQGEPWTFGPGWSSTPGPGPRCGTQVYSPGLLISSRQREREMGSRARKVVLLGGLFQGQYRYRLLLVIKESDNQYLEPTYHIFNIFSYLLLCVSRYLIEAN